MRVGLDDEPWLPACSQAVERAGAFDPAAPTVLDCSKGIASCPPTSGRGGEERAVHDSGNPHYLLDPDNARPVTAAIRDALARIAPPTGRDSTHNRTGFLALLDDAPRPLVGGDGALQGSRIVLMHDTWPYLARRFGLIVAGAVEPAPGVSPIARLSRRSRQADAGARTSPRSSAGRSPMTR